MLYNKYHLVLKAYLPKKNCVSQKKSVSDIQQSHVMTEGTRNPLSFTFFFKGKRNEPTSRQEGSSGSNGHCSRR